MTDTKMEPRSLTSAVVREVFPPPPPLAGWVGFYWDSGFYDSEQGTNEDAGWYCSGKVHATREDALCELAGFRPFEGSALVEVGSALFGESASEGGKVRLPNARKILEWQRAVRFGSGDDSGKIWTEIVCGLAEIDAAEGRK